MDMLVPIVVFIIVFTVVIGFILSYFAQRLSGNENPKVQQVGELLPGNNCGGCGFANCGAFAEALVSDPGYLGSCVLCSHECEVKIAELLGVEPPGKHSRKVARVRCQGGEHCADRAVYQGISSCRASLQLGSFKECGYGCLGFGDCVDACEFDAITVVNGVPEVDTHKCVGCGKCAEACPQGLITIEPVHHLVCVKCISTEEKKHKVRNCTKSCSGCGVCAKNCPKEAITIEKGLARIDYDKCVGCGICVQKCPRQVIVQFKKPR